MTCERCGIEPGELKVVHHGRTFVIQAWHRAPCGAPCFHSGAFLVGDDWHTESWCSRGCYQLPEPKKST